ncbi:snRNA-activating protein complex subunit 2 isoform 1-T2 [Discoglossus pictus]
MKPPVRSRAAPVRYETISAIPRAGPLRLTWTGKDKIELLRGLKSQKDEKEPEPTVHGRSQGEVSSYISWLRGRTAREAVQTEYERWVQQRRAKETVSPAPIELWTDLACRVSHPTEQAVTAAFSQMLTIAATEPVSLKHSMPSKAPKGRSSKASRAQKSASSETVLPEQGTSAQGTGSTGAETAALKDGTTEELKGLDFEKIYKYLSKSARGEVLPKLSEMESAVLLRLLHCLPDQIRTMDTYPLATYMRDTYAHLNSSPDAEQHATTDEVGSEQQRSFSKDSGFCPLNPFQIPLQLLKHKESD